MGERQIVHLLNFRNADSTSWKDSRGTMPEPEKIEQLEIEIGTAKPARRLWMASPDTNLGVPSELTFTQSEGKIRTEIPSLKYWNMIVIEY
jgi:dextranase